MRHGVEPQPPALIGYLRAIDIMLLFLTKQIHRLLVYSNISWPVVAFPVLISETFSCIILVQKGRRETMTTNKDLVQCWLLSEDVKVTN